MEFKVGDKVRSTQIHTVIEIRNHGNSIQLEDRRYLRDASSLELVERPEPPLPDWLTEVKTGKVVSVNGIVYISVDNWWRSMNNHVIYLNQMKQYYLEGKVVRLVPEA